MAPRILGHRGASGHAPENTVAAFRLAIEAGADGVELDVHATRDGHLVVHHDPAIPGLGPIGRLDLAAVRAAALPHGQPIPLLEEALDAVAGHEAWVEIKDLPPAADEALLGILAAAAARCAVHSFDHRIVARLGKLQPALRRGVLAASYPLDPITPVRAAGAGALWQVWHLIDEDLVGQAHRAGIEVIAWTVNERHDAERLAGLGVDALCGNYPERLRLH